MFAAIFSRWGINLVYERGAFIQETTIRTAIAFAIYILGIPAISFRNMTVQYYQAYKKTNIPLFMSAINIAINIILNFILVKRLAYIGLALATTLSYYALLPLEVVLIKRLCKEFEFHTRIRRYMLLLIATVIPCVLTGFIIQKLNSFYCSQGFVIRMSMFLALLGFSAIGFCLIASGFKVINLKSLLAKIRKTEKKS